MEFKARTVTKNYLQLVPGHLKYLGPHVLVEFIVANMTIEEGKYYIYTQPQDKFKKRI